MNLISEALKLVNYSEPIRRKFTFRKSLDVLKHDGGRTGFAHKSNGFREKVSLVGSTELASCH
jgi:hypothetical protein